MELSKAFVIVFAGALLAKEFDSQPFDQPHLHTGIEASDTLDFSVPISASASPNALLSPSSYPSRK